MSPTGTVIGLPVSTAFMPRTKPSVGFHCDAAHGILTDVLRNLDRDDLTVVVDRNSIQQLRNARGGKFNVKHAVR